MAAPPCEDDRAEAAQELLQAAKDGAARYEGSLLGAILRVRFRDGLVEHVKLLMERLKNRETPGGGDLFYAFAYIAAMHTVGTTFLSRTVLSEVLGCPSDELSPSVLSPLGMEAATSNDGQFVLTRHVEIARAALTLLFDVFEVDIDSLYLKLTASAETIRVSGGFVPNLRRWQFDLADHFFEIGRRDLAIRIAETLHSMNSPSPQLRQHLSRLYRESGDPGRAIRLFNNIDDLALRYPSTFLEWGRAETLASERIRGTLLIAFSIATNPLRIRLFDAKQAAKGLSGLAESLDLLYTDYIDADFKRGCEAAVRLCLLLPISEKSRSHLEKFLPVSGSAMRDVVNLGDELSLLEKTLSKVKDYHVPEDSNKADAIISSTPLAFDHLRRLLRNAAQAPDQTTD